MSSKLDAAGARGVAGVEGLSVANWSLWRSVLIALWVAWAALLFGPVAMQGSIPGWCRLTSSLTLVLAGWTWFTATRGERSNRYALLIAIGMTLGLVGDWFNARNVIIGGIVAFGIGHVAYIAACAYAARVAELRSQGARWWSLTAWWLIGLMSWFFVVYRGSKHGELIWPALPYTLLLAGTAGMATSLAAQHRAFFLLAIGAALFLISDLVLAFRLFSGEFSLGGEAVWLLYGPAQMLIVYALLTARSILNRQADSP